MQPDHPDMEAVMVEFTAEELDELDDLAFQRHRDNREAAIRDLLDEWLNSRE